MNEFQRNVAASMAAEQQYRAWEAAQGQPAVPHQGAPPACAVDPYAVERAAVTELLKTITDPVERLLTAMTALKSHGPVSVWGLGGMIMPWQKYLAEMAPDVVDAQWVIRLTTREVCQSFISRAIEVQLSSTTFSPIVCRRKFMRGWCYVEQDPVQAWNLGRAIPQYWRGEMAEPADLFILRDGRAMCHTQRQMGSTGAESKTVSVLPDLVLKDMGLRLRLDLASRTHGSQG